MNNINFTERVEESLQHVVKENYNALRNVANALQNVANTFENDYNALETFPTR